MSRVADVPIVHPTTLLSHLQKGILRDPSAPFHYVRKINPLETFLEVVPSSAKIFTAERPDAFSPNAHYFDPQSKIEIYTKKERYWTVASYVSTVAIFIINQSVSLLLSFYIGPASLAIADVGLKALSILISYKLSTYIKCEAQEYTNKIDYEKRVLVQLNHIRGGNFDFFAKMKELQIVIAVEKTEPLFAAYEALLAHYLVTKEMADTALAEYQKKCDTADPDTVQRLSEDAIKHKMEAVYFLRRLLKPNERYRHDWETPCVDGTYFLLNEKELSYEEVHNLSKQEILELIL